MGDETKIEWAGVPGYQAATWNPIRARLKEVADRARQAGLPTPVKIKGGEVGWHCVKVPKRRGCAHCYAASWNQFRGTGLDYTRRNEEKVEIFLHEVDLPTRKTKPHCWFVNSMTDVFGEFVTDDQIHELFKVMLANKRHIFIILTKRHERAHAYITKYHPNLGNYPHIWFGGSAEDQDSAEQALLWTLRTPAAVRLISYEPAVGPVDWGKAYSVYWHSANAESKQHYQAFRPNGLDWLLIGGESGQHTAPFDVEWARSAIMWCRAAEVAPFVKQLGAQVVDHYETKDGTWATTPTQHLEEPGFRPVPRKLNDKKGGDMAEWPADIRVREFPAREEVLA